MLVAYLAHPVGESPQERGDCSSNSIEWFKFIVRITQWSIVAPWKLYEQGLPQSHWDERRLLDQLAALERCDILILTGGIIDQPMHEAIRRAHRLGIPVLDLTMMGVSPPDPDEDIALQITNRARRLVVTRHRRVWLPLLTIHDLESLKDARHALYTALPGEHDPAVRMIDRIIAAAFDSGI